ncbi:MAG: N-acetyltransferase [Gammaproteobacteria bacterium]|nr:N-acetyltransferase [Gammaproteobacteria bacterium]
MNVAVRPIQGRRDLRAFLRVPWPIYAGDPCWVPPLLLERAQALAPGNPFFEHARWQGWIAWRDGKPIGRISAQIDELHQQRYGDATGYFGLFECGDEPAVAQALFAAACGWLRERGMRRVTGPFNLGINQEIGVLVEGFDTPPKVMMGHARPYYDALLQGCGLSKAVDVLAYEIETLFPISKAMNAVLERYRNRIRVRPLQKRRLDAELEIMRDIFNDAWSNNWGFVPFTEKEFRAAGHEMLLLIPPDMVQIADLDGTPAAFMVTLPNLNEAIADLDGRLLPFGWLKLLWRLKVRYPSSGRVALMGVRQPFQNSRTGAALAFAVINASRAPVSGAGIRTAEMSWILEDNKGMRSIIESIGGVVSKRYRMYQGPLA